MTITFAQKTFAKNEEEEDEMKVDDLKDIQLKRPFVSTGKLRCLGHSK